MPQTRPFFRHIHHATGIMARVPEPERYPYHFRMECAVGQKVKQSGDWQYYQARPGEEREQCPICAKFYAVNPAAPHR